MGCTDRNCIFRNNLVGTNGGCRCLEEIKNPTIKVKLRDKVLRMRDVLIEISESDCDYWGLHNHDVNCRACKAREVLNE